jgi:hypothetical protein
LTTALWFGWSFVCAFLTRVAFAAVLRKHLGGFAYLGAYAGWVGLLIIGGIAVSFSGMQMYGFDADDPRQMFSYWVLFYSPLGLPLVFGAPAVLVVDGVRWILRLRRPKP